MKDISPDEERRYVSGEEIMAIAMNMRPEEPAVPEAQKSFLDIADEPYADPKTLSRLFKALGNETRLEIVEILQLQPARVTDIAFILEDEPHHLLPHMRTLVQAGVVTMERRGTNKFYALRRSVTPLLKEAVCHIFSPS